MRRKKNAVDLLFIMTFLIVLIKLLLFINIGKLKFYYLLLYFLFIIFKIS